MSWLDRALADTRVVERYRSKVVVTDGCWWWSGAISGAGHGRFWAQPGHVVIAHRFGWALNFGSAALATAPILAHRCDNPLCQRPGPDHLVVSSAALNRREWAIRRSIAGLPLADPRGARGRAQALRDLARLGAGAIAADLQRVVETTGEQRTLF